MLHSVTFLLAGLTGFTHAISVQSPAHLAMRNKIESCPAASGDSILIGDFKFLVECDVDYPGPVDDGYVPYTDVDFWTCASWYTNYYKGRNHLGRIIYDANARICYWMGNTTGYATPKPASGVYSALFTGYSVPHRRDLIPRRTQRRELPNISIDKRSLSGSLSAGKRGLAYNNPARVAGFRASGSKVVWGWNWYSTPYGGNCNNNEYANTGSMSNGMNFVPNMWSCLDSCLRNVWTANVKSDITHYGTNAIIAFNEPDQATSVGGSNIPVDTAVLAYKSLMMPFAGKLALGAPAVTWTGSGTWGGTWLFDFIDNCTSCRIDFVPVHFYIGSWGDDQAAVTLFKNEVWNLYKRVRKPIWITEMRYIGVSTASETVFMKGAMKWMDDHSFIGRYSYATAEQLTNTGGGLTTLGKLYATY